MTPTPPTADERDRLRAAIERRHLRPRKFAELTGWTYAYAAEALRGERPGCLPFWARMREEARG